MRSPADCEGMFDVLTYQKGGALLRMLEQYLGVERFRDGVSHYLRPHAYAQHRDERPVGRDRGDDRRAGAADHGLVDLAARLPARDGLASTATTARRSPSSGSRSTPTIRADPRSWAIPVHVAQRRLAVETRAARRATRPRARRSTDPTAPVVVNAGGHGFFRVAYDDELRARLDGEVLAALTPSSATTSSTTPGRRRRRPARRPPSCCAFLEGFAGERELRRVAGDRRSACAASAGSSTTTRPRVPGAGRAARRAGARRARRAGRRREPTSRQAARPAGRRARRARRRRRHPGSAAASGTTRRGGAELGRPRAGRRGHVGASPRPATTTTTSRCSAGFRTAPTPQEQLRHLYALAEFDDEALILRTCEFAMSGEVKTQNAPFLLRTCIANRRHGAPAWAFVRDHWDEANERFPTNTIVRMVDSVKLLNRPGVGRRRAGVLRRAPDRAGRQDARADPRASARQRRPARARADALAAAL